MSTAARRFRHISDVPMYNIQAAARATGVPAPTLRSWERRYGVPSPEHDAHGYRLYSDRDLAIVQWLQEHIRNGVAVSCAVQMLEVEEEDRIDDVESDPALSTALCNQLVQSITAMDEPGVNAVIARALQSLPVEDVSLYVFQPALYRVGDLWAQGELSVTTERFASNLVRVYVAQLMQLSPAPVHSQRVLIGCAPGEQHDLGALMLALFVRRAGFAVLYAGANLEPESLLNDAVRLDPGAVCLSASTPLILPALIDLCERLRRVYRGVVAFGGRMFVEDPALLERIPGVYLGDDAAVAVQTLANLLTRDGDRYR